MAQEISLERYKKAYRAVESEEELRGFFIHLVIYVIVNATLFVINIISSPSVIWFIWPLIGWGFGLFVHYLFGVLYVRRDLERKESMAEARAKK